MGHIVFLGGFRKALVCQQPRGDVIQDCASFDLIMRFMIHAGINFEGLVAGTAVQSLRPKGTIFDLFVGDDELIRHLGT